MNNVILLGCFLLGLSEYGLCSVWVSILVGISLFLFSGLLSMIEVSIDILDLGLDFFFLGLNEIEVINL